MEYEIFLTYATVLLPVIFGFLILKTENKILRNILSFIFCLLIILDSWILFFLENIFVFVNHICYYVSAIDIILLLISIGISVKKKKIFIFALSFLQISFLYYFLILKKHTCGDPLFLCADHFSKFMILAVSSCVSIFVFLWLLYSKNDTKLKSRYAGYFLFFLSLTNLFFLTNNIYFLPICVNIIALLLYRLIVRLKSEGAGDVAESAMSSLLFVSFLFSISVFFLYAYNGGESGMSISSLIKRGSLKSAQKVSIAIILIYFGSFILSGLHPFTHWIKKVVNLDHFLSAIFNLCLLTTGIYLVMRFSPSFIMLSYSGHTTGKIVGYAISFFGAFSFFASSAELFLKDKIEEAKYLPIPLIASIITICCGGANSESSVSALFLFFFAYGILFLLYLSKIRATDPILSWSFKLLLLISFIPPFGIFFAVWLFFESLLCISFYYISSTFISFTLNLTSIFVFLFLAFGFILLIISMCRFLSILKFSQFKLRHSAFSGVASAVVSLSALYLFSCLNLSIIYQFVKIAVRGVIPVDSKLPYIYSSLTETGILNQMLVDGSNIFLGAFPSLQIFFIAFTIFYFLYFIFKRKELPTFNMENARITLRLWNLIKLRILKFLSKSEVIYFFNIFGFILLSFIFGISAGITFR